MPLLDPFRSHADSRAREGAGPVISLSVAHRFLSPGRAVLSCNSFGVTVDVSSIKITAIKAGTLTLVRL